MRVEPDVGFTEVLANEAGDEHKLVTMHPDHLEIFELLSYFDNFLCDFVVDKLIGWPKIDLIFTDEVEVVHFWLNLQFVVD